MTDLLSERARSTRLVRREGYSSAMSDTKWRKLLNALKTIDAHNVIVKFVGIAETATLTISAIGLHSPHRFVDTLEFGPIDLASIEWLELSRKVYEQMPSVGQLMLEPRGDTVRIIGHRK